MPWAGTLRGSWAHGMAGGQAQGVIHSAPSADSSAGPGALRALHCLSPGSGQPCPGAPAPKSDRLSPRAHPAPCCRWAGGLGAHARLFSCSYDGSIRRLDVSAGVFDPIVLQCAPGCRVQGITVYRNAACLPAGLGARLFSCSYNGSTRRLDRSAQACSIVSCCSGRPAAGSRGSGLTGDARPCMACPRMPPCVHGCWHASST